MIQSLLFGWLTKYSQDTFSGTVDTGLHDTDDSPYFTAIKPQVVAARASYDNYLVAKANAAQGGKDLISLRNTARTETVDLLRPLLSNINAVANGDVDKLLSSGFPLSKSHRTPVGPLPAPLAPVVTQGPNSGDLRAVTPTIPGGALYTARLALASAPNVYIVTKQQTGSRFLFTGLTAGEMYNVAINVIGSSGPSDFSDPGSLRVI